jgi:hypothetical protein
MTPLSSCAPSGPDEIEHRCSYFGLIISGNVFGLFGLLVRGVDGHEEGDQWANEAAEMMGRTTRADLIVNENSAEKPTQVLN